MRVRLTHGRLFKIIIVMILLLFAIMALYEVRLKFQLVTLAEVKYKLFMLMFALLLLCLSSAAMINRIANAVIAKRKFPPPGIEPLIKFPPLEGSKAVLRGRILQLLAMTFLAIGGYAVFYVIQLLRTFS